MSIITITLTESPLQLLAGIPSTVTLDSNIPATIFYTLDGTTPTTDSFVAFGPIDMPTNQGQVILKALATNGDTTSAILEQVYITNVTFARNPHDKILNGNNNSFQKPSFPFGSGNVEAPIYGNTTGVIVDNKELPEFADGYDGTGTGTGAGFLNEPKQSYQFLFSETNAIGESGKGIGTLPARVLYSKPRNDNTTQISSNAAGPLFNPRALVIFQDSSQEPYDADVPKINRPYFDLEDHTKARDGTLLTNSEAVTTSGSFVKAHFNPKDNVLTYYYYDNKVSRWIISREPYNPNTNPTINMSGIVSRPGRDNGNGLVFKWIPGRYRSLI